MTYKNSHGVGVSPLTDIVSKTEWSNEVVLLPNLQYYENVWLVDITFGPVQTKWDILLKELLSGMANPGSSNDTSFVKKDRPVTWAGEAHLLL